MPEFGTAFSSLANDRKLTDEELINGLKPLPLVVVQ